MPPPQPSAAYSVPPRARSSQLRVAGPPAARGESGIIIRGVKKLLKGAVAELEREQQSSEQKVKDWVERGLAELEGALERKQREMWEGASCSLRS